MRVVAPLFINKEGYNVLDDADIDCVIIPDRFLFVDGKLERWDTFVEDLNRGLLFFKRLKVSLGQFVILSGALNEYEQSNTKEVKG